VMNKRLATRDYLSGSYSIADMACVGWVRLYERQGQDIEQFPHLKAWLERLLARPAVQKGIDVLKELRKPPDPTNKEAFNLLFQQKARD
jgi:GSH-dependent disulfide-bond oxidoreductase